MFISLFVTGIALSFKPSLTLKLIKVFLSYFKYLTSFCEICSSAFTVHSNFCFIDFFITFSLPFSLTYLASKFIADSFEYSSFEIASPFLNLTGISIFFDSPAFISFNSIMLSLIAFISLDVLSLEVNDVSALLATSV